MAKKKNKNKCRKRIYARETKYLSLKIEKRKKKGRKRRGNVCSFHLGSTHTKNNFQTIFKQNENGEKRSARKNKILKTCFFLIEVFLNFTCHRRAKKKKHIHTDKKKKKKKNYAKYSKGPFNLLDFSSFLASVLFPSAC